MKKPWLTKILILAILVASIPFWDIKKAGATTTDFTPSDDAYMESYDATTWATAWGATDADTMTDTQLIAGTRGAAPFYIYTQFLNFDTSSIPDGDTITGATLTLVGYNTTNPLNSRSYLPYSSTAADTITTADFDQRGTTAYSDTAIASADWNTSGNNTWTLNAAGIAAINKTGLTKISIREVIYDVGNTEPADIAYIWARSSATAGSEPKLTVTYSSGAVASTPGGFTQRAYLID